MQQAYNNISHQHIWMQQIYYENNYYAFADGENNMGGLLELVEYKGDKYIVISTILLDNLESESGYIQDNLEEFNKLNNVEPLTI